MNYQTRGEALNPQGNSNTSAKEQTSVPYSLPSKLTSRLISPAKNFMTMNFQSAANSSDNRKRQLANTVPGTKKQAARNYHMRFHLKNNANTLMEMPRISKENRVSTAHSRLSENDRKTPVKDYTFKTKDGQLVVGGRKYPIHRMAMHKLSDIPVEDDEDNVNDEVADPQSKLEKGGDNWKPSFSSALGITFKKRSSQDPTNASATPVTSISKPDIVRNVVPTSSTPNATHKPLPSWKR
jgi:hypothetical protein